MAQRKFFQSNGSKENFQIKIGFKTLADESAEMLHYFFVFCEGLDAVHGTYAAYYIQVGVRQVQTARAQELPHLGERLGSPTQRKSRQSQVAEQRRVNGGEKKPDRKEGHRRPFRIAQEAICVLERVG